MKFLTVFLFVLTTFALGCTQEPETPREKAERAQEELEDAREEAAETIAEAEEDAVETVADAREEAQADLRQAKSKAADNVEDAERELENQLDQLSDPQFVEDDPAVPQEEGDELILREDTDVQEQPRVRVEIEGGNPEKESNPE